METCTWLVWSACRASATAAAAACERFTAAVRAWVWSATSFWPAANFFFERADLRLTLEDAGLRGIIAGGLTSLEETVAVEEFAGERGDGPFRVLAAEFAGGGEGFGDDAVRRAGD